MPSPSYQITMANSQKILMNANRKNKQIICIYSMMFNRSKKLTLNAPYSKISKALWQNKKTNTQKQKENLRLHTKVQHLHNSKSIKQQQSGHSRKLQEKYQKYANKYKEQAKWIKETNQMIEERKYEELSNEVKKIENKLYSATQKAITSEKKLQKYSKKMKKYEVKAGQELGQVAKRQYKSPFQELQAQKQQLQKELQSRLQYSKDIDEAGKLLNKQIIQLLAIKNKLRNQVKESRQYESNYQRPPLCKPTSELIKKQSKRN